MRNFGVILAFCAATACTTETMSVSSSDPAAPAASASASQTTSYAGLINDFRASQGQPPLRQNAAMTQAATSHAQDMVARGYFSHTGQNASTPGRRLRIAGCEWTGVAENIAQGQTTASAAMEAWINSPGHRANLLGPHTQFGMAQAGTIWVLVVGSGC